MPRWLRWLINVVVFFVVILFIGYVVWPGWALGHPLWGPWNGESVQAQGQTATATPRPTARPTATPQATADVDQIREEAEAAAMARIQPTLEAMQAQIANMNAASNSNGNQTGSSQSDPSPTATSRPTARPTTTAPANDENAETASADRQEVMPASGGNTTGCAGTGRTYTTYSPSAWNWDALHAQSEPSMAQFLADHGLTSNDIQAFEPMNVSWEPALYVVELREDLYGNVQIPLVQGYVYTLALVDETVEVMWGGDPAVLCADLLWGFSARWVPSYEGMPYQWLNPDDPRELVAREYRFGRYLRNIEMEPVRSDVVYFDRVGPYYTGPGNTNTRGWMPPALDATIPKSFMDACAMLGGLCNQNEWANGEPASGGYLNWSWKYSAKVSGSGDYCPTGMPCWQTVYVPDGAGYVELWLSQGTTGPNGSPVQNSGPYKFYAGTQQILADGGHNVDEFSYHADPTR